MRRESKDNLQRHYTLMDKVQLAWFLLRSKLIDSNIRLVRFPFIVRGRQFVDFGKQLTTGYWCRFEVFPADNNPRKRLILGNNIQMNDFVHICAIDCVEIGDGCLFASHIYISDNSHGRMEGGIMIHLLKFNQIIGNMLRHRSKSVRMFGLGKALLSCLVLQLVMAQ